jgi:hypothetical protein
MHTRANACVALSALHLLFIAGGSARSDESRKPPVEATPATNEARRAVEKGLVFLVKDAAIWREKKTCATCHHGTMTVWALSEAKSRGYAVAPETLADLVKWTKDRVLEGVDKPRDKRAGWNMVNTSGLFLAAMAQAVPKQEAVSADELKRIAGQLVRHQESDGSWAWSIAPPANRFPPVFESDEVATLLAYLALESHVPADAKEKSEVRDSRGKAVAWLAKTKPADTTQAAAFRLLVKVRAGGPAKDYTKDLDEFLGLQNKDGGWGQLASMPSDAYATGQALYMLSLVGVKNDRAEVRRGVAFLVAGQRTDGSWPMTPRAQPGAKPATNTVPIIYFGSAWATLGLLRSVPK